MPPAVQAVVLAASGGAPPVDGTASGLQALLGRPLLEWVLRAVEPLGARPLLVVAAEAAEAVRAACGVRAQVLAGEAGQGFRATVAAAVRGGGLRPESPLLVVDGNLPLLCTDTLRLLLDHHGSSGAAATLLSARLAQPGDRARIVRDADGRVRALVATQAAASGERPEAEVAVGVYVFGAGAAPAAFAAAGGGAGDDGPAAVAARLAAAGARVEALAAEDPRVACRVWSLAELAALAATLRAERNQTLMAAGVVVEDPETTWVSPDAEVEPGVVLRPGSLLEGRTTIRRGARIGPFARLVDSEVGAGAQVLDHCVLLEARVDARATIGPFAHLRPGTTVGEGARVGNFVELKKTQLGAGAKAPHLSYLGDAVVGPRANIGAGTITCNYDGHAKHPTQIGEGAFVGSDTTLVAPLSVGAGSYVGAGSTITKDVPEDALALSRAPQLVKPGWAKRRREARAKTPHEPGR
jgi:bifunctional UDP-N-acetylglucosamine pyrophosphorylase/glucosamine-1-phosphate N-acetyltransferase